MPLWQQNWSGVCLFVFFRESNKKNVLLLITIIERTEAKNSPQGAITITRTHISIVLHAKKLINKHMNNYIYGITGNEKSN